MGMENTKYAIKRSKGLGWLIIVLVTLTALTSESPDKSIVTDHQKESPQ